MMRLLRGLCICFLGLSLSVATIGCGGGDKPAAAPTTPEAPKPDAPKPDAPKPDAPKPDAPKPDAPKPDSGK